MTTTKVPYSITFTIDGLPKTTNQTRRNGHWSQTRKDYAVWHKSVWAMCAQQGIPRIPLSKARLTLTRFSSVQPDNDGLVSTFKPIIDGLVISRVLTNDTPMVIGFPQYNWQKCKPKEGKIMVTIEEMQT